jgi:hypothetical protein
VISFRYHVVSIVAVLLALAAGVALGGGPLSEIGRGSGDEATQRAEARTEQLNRRLDAANADAGFQDEFARMASSRVLQGSLDQRPVALVTTPGADQAVVESITELVQQSGGSVTGTYAIQPQLVAGDGKSLVDTLGTQLLEAVKDTGVPANATTYDRMGQLIGRAIATVEDRGKQTDTAATDILSSLKGAELMTRADGGNTQASLVIVVLGDEPADPRDADQVLGGLFAGMAAQSDGVVVAGSSTSGIDGVLAQLRDEVAFNANVSTVDSVDSAAGRVTAVLALAADARGEPGHYGASGIDGPAPRG